MEQQIGVDFSHGYNALVEKQWKKYSKTYVIKDNTTSVHFNFNVVKNGTYWVSSPKIEFGDTVTSWCPNVADASYDSELANTIYDISGYENNGEMINNPSFNSDSIIGKYSLYCGENQYVVAQNTNVDKIFNNEFTISTWVKITNLINTFQGIMSYGIANALQQIFILKSVNYSPPRFMVSFYGSDLAIEGVDIQNNWVNLIVTYKNKTKKVYINGEYCGEQTDSTGLNVPENLPLYVGRGRNDNHHLLGFIDDFRIYATALSSDDIKRLYNERIKVDNIGNVYCNELDEEERTVEYLESTGTQYIDTEYIPNQNTHIIVNFQYTENNQGYRFTGAEELSPNTLAFRFGTSEGKYWLARYNQEQGRVEASDMDKHELDFNKNIVSLDKKILFSFNYTVFTANRNMYIFSINSNNIRDLASAKLYSYKIYDNNILVRDFLPTISTEDGHIGEPCLFDTVENKYYYNKGTGTFKTNLTDSNTNVNITDKGILNCRYLIEGNNLAKVLQDENIVKVNEIKEN